MKILQFSFRLKFEREIELEVIIKRIKCLAMSDFWKNILSISLGITTTGFSFIPENFFREIKRWSILPIYWSDTINKLCFLLLISVIVAVTICLYRRYRTSVRFKGQDYNIVVEYGDIFNQEKCKKVINFDECYSTELGNSPHQIKPTSICGQFLVKFPNLNIGYLINSHSLKPLRKRSKFENRECFESGTLMANGDYLLMAFGKLNGDGRTEMSREDYLKSLRTLWQELDKYYTQSDIAIPVLGAGITRFQDCLLDQQQLVDIIICSYKMSPYKLKLPNTLHIICKKAPDFSLNKVLRAL